MKYALSLALLLALAGCSDAGKPPAANDTQNAAPNATEQAQDNGRLVVYQVFTRLFGNTNSTNKAWGTAAENGVGKFSHFTPAALAEIKALGVTHIWYTGVLHHAMVADYSQYGISNDDPDVVKGRAGSPYAVKDYYSVDPDLADNPAQRLEEFRALIDRTHAAGLKVIMDIVPNHVARHYQSQHKPAGVRDFGADDDTNVEYARDNNFYYVPDQAFAVPQWPADYQPLGGEPHPAADGQFVEVPAKWTGNGSRSPQPAYDDWYETVKINYGVRPDGSHDFPDLPESLHGAPWPQHHAFWAGKSVPDSWLKFRDITQYWLAMGIDGFRFDVAELVPVQFWSYLNSHIKHTNADAFLLAEAYDRNQYRNYLQLGLMDYLYDKVDLYDSLRRVIQDGQTTAEISTIADQLTDIDGRMLRFLENHDEQRIASPQFAGSPEKAMPAMVVSALLGSGPTMIYFGQEVGEPGAEQAGFGQPSRTSIFDYIGVPHHQRWMNGGAFDGGQLTAAENQLRRQYAQLLTLSRSEPAFAGERIDLHGLNLGKSKGNYSDTLYSFARRSESQTLVVVSNFSADAQPVTLQLPAALADATAERSLQDLLADQTVQQSGHQLQLNLPAYGSAVIQL